MEDVYLILSLGISFGSSLSLNSEKIDKSIEWKIPDYKLEQYLFAFCHTQNSNSYDNWTTNSTNSSTNSTTVFFTTLDLQL